MIWFSPDDLTLIKKILLLFGVVFSLFRVVSISAFFLKQTNNRFRRETLKTDTSLLRGLLGSLLGLLASLVMLVAFF